MEGDNKVYLSPTDFGLEYAGGNGVNHLRIKKADQSLDFKYEDQLATFDNTNGLVLNSSGKLLTYKDKELYVSYDQGSNIKLHPINGVVVNYDSKSLGITGDDLTYDDGTNTYFVSDSKLSLKEKSGDKELEITDAKSYLKYDASTSISYENDKLTTIYGDKVFELSSDMQIGYTDPDNQLSIDPSGMSLGRGSKTVSLNPSSTASDMDMDISLSATEYLRITDGLMEFSDGGNEVKLGSQALYYSDGTRSIDLSKDDLELVEGDNTLTLGSSSFGLTIGSEKHLFINKATQKVDFKYDDVSASFSSQESLSFSAGDKSFSLGSTGLSLEDGPRKIAVLSDNGNQAIELDDGTNRFYVNNNGFEVDFDDKHFAINDKEYLHVDIDSNRFIKVDNNSATYNENGTELIIGGSTNFLEIKDDVRSVALTQDEKLKYTEANYSAALSKDLKVELSDGIRNISLFGDNHVLKYQQDSYEFGIRGGSGVKPGLDLTVDGNTIFVEGERNKDVTVGVQSQQFGDVSLTCDNQKNIDASFAYAGKEIVLKAGEQGISLNNSDDPAPDAVADNLEGATATPDMNGPQYLDSKITDGNGGKAKGRIEVYYNSGAESFIGNASIASTVPPCVDAAMSIEVVKDDWEVNIGTESDRIQLFPTCGGFGGGGWLGLTPQEIDVGVFLAWAVRGEVGIGDDACGADLWAAVSAELGVRAKADLQPFKIRNVGVWVDLYAGIGVDYWCVAVSGDLTLAEAGLSGTLDLYFEDKTRVKGALSGYITILEIISADFDMDFDTRF